MKGKHVALQWTGGRDSLLAAIHVAEEFDSVHLLTFEHSLTLHKERALANIIKLQSMFGTDKFLHHFISIEDMLKQLHTGSWWRDFRKYRWYIACTFCGCCRLCHHSATIIFCQERDIQTAADGANLTGFDISQQSFVIPLFRELYQSFGIDYITPVYDVPRTDLELLNLSANNPSAPLLYGIQPFCQGGGEWHNVLLRAWYLPNHGKETYVETVKAWTKDKLEECRSYIEQGAFAQEKN